MDNISALWSVFLKERKLQAKDLEKHLQNMYLVKDMYPKYLKYSQNSV